MIIVETPERLGRAGLKKIGLGALYGLDTGARIRLCAASHLRYMERHYWQSRYSLSFSRIRPNEGGFEPVSTMSDRDLVQVICAFRLLSQEVELSLSTREHPAFRDNVGAGHHIDERRIEDES